MPVEIRELIIRVSVTDNQAESRSGSSEEAARLSGTTQENIIQEAVRRVLQILEKQKER